MIFRQFMVSDCCEMFYYRNRRYVVFFVIFILPLFASAETVRLRRRPSVDQEVKNHATKFPDQVAEATRFESNQLASATYSADKEAASGNTRHGKIVVRVAEPAKKESINSLSNSRTAEEYVHNALKLHTGIQPPIPERINKITSEQSDVVIKLKTKSPEPVAHVQQQNIPSSTAKFPDYEVYENMYTDTPYAAYEKDSVTPSNYASYEYGEQTSPATATPNLYQGYSGEIYNYLNRPSTPDSPQYLANVNYQLADSSDYYDNTEQSTAKSTQIYQEPEQITVKHYEQQQLFQPMAKSSLYYEHPSKQPINNHRDYYKQYVPRHRNNEAEMHTSKLPKGQILKQIEESVNNYMRILEGDGKTTRSTSESKHTPNYIYRSKYPEKAKIVSADQNPVQDIIENLNDNVHFIYKARTRPPIPKMIPLNFDQKAPPNHQPEFNSPQVLTGELPKHQRQPLQSFIPEGYHERNELSFRRPQQLNPKLKNNNKFRLENHQLNKNVAEIRPVGNENPFQIVLQKQPAQSNWKPINPLNVQNDNYGVEYDSYSPKFNNNPNGYGYQHNYKSSETRPSNRSAKRHVKPTKPRDKRGGSGKFIARNNFHLGKDQEADIALRPPPL